MTGVQPLAPGKRMVGQAFTLRYIPAREDLDYNLVFDNATDPQRVAIERVGPRDVLVIDARGDERAGTMGNILATRMVARGAVGIVTDGCYRDSPFKRSLAAVYKSFTNNTKQTYPSVTRTFAFGVPHSIFNKSVAAVLKGFKNKLQTCVLG